MEQCTVVNKKYEKRVFAAAASKTLTNGQVLVQMAGKTHPSKAFTMYQKPHSPKGAHGSC